MRGNRQACWKQYGQNDVPYWVVSDLEKEILTRRDLRFADKPSIPLIETGESWHVGWDIPTRWAIDAHKDLYMDNAHGGLLHRLDLTICKLENYIEDDASYIEIRELLSSTNTSSDTNTKIDIKHISEVEKWRLVFLAKSVGLSDTGLTDMLDSFNLFSKIPMSKNAVSKVYKNRASKDIALAILGEKDMSNFSTSNDVLDRIIKELSGK